MVSSAKKAKVPAPKVLKSSEPSMEESYESEPSFHDSEEPNYGPPEMFFFGCELGEDATEFTWDYRDPRSESQANMEESSIDLNDSDAMKQTLHLRQVTLGVDAKEGERNIVALETEDDNGDKVSFVVASLSVGTQEMASFNLDFKDTVPLTLRLISGSGPVCVTGMTEKILEYPEDVAELRLQQENLAHSKVNTEKSGPITPPSVDEEESEEIESEEDEDMEEEEEIEEKVKVKKRKVDGSAVKKVKSPSHKVMKKQLKAKWIPTKRNKKSTKQ